VLKEIDSGLSPQYLCGAKQDKTGAMKGDALLSSEEMTELSETLKNTVITIADTMTSGCMNASPSKTNNQYRCENCNMRSICRAKRKS
jgi:CRISPR/Cas system-associated exonuclease Cas4 (RecB family)